MRKIFSEEQLSFIRSNYANMTYGEMSKLTLFDRLSEKQIRNKARNLGLSKIRKYDKRYFENIDSAEKAYWIGMLYADGAISKNKEKRNYETTLELHENDKYLLLQLNKALGGIHDVVDRTRDIVFNGYSYTTKTSRIRFYSKDMVEDLEKHGFSQNKTYSDMFPIVENDYFMDFLRGFMDGDGSIFIQKKSLGVTFTNSSKKFLSHLSERLKEYDIISSIYKEKEYKYRLHISMKDTEKALGKIYQDCENLKLKRKYNIYEQWLSLQEIVE